MKPLSPQEIIEVNRRVIHAIDAGSVTAGVVINPNSLLYIAEAGEAEFGGNPLYPSICHRAAVYAYLINRDHVFFDGNKRTSMVCALLYLRRNGRRLRPDLKQSDIVTVALEIACGHMSFGSVVEWLRECVVDSAG